MSVKKVSAVYSNLGVRLNFPVKAQDLLISVLKIFHKNLSFILIKKTLVKKL